MKIYQLTINSFDSLKYMSITTFDAIFTASEVCVLDFYDLSVCVGRWSLVFIRRMIYKHCNVRPFNYIITVAGVGRFGPLTD